MKTDNINNPAHYTSHPSGHQAIEFCGEMNFALGNAFKYLYRAGLKGSALEDLKKARWYLRYEMDRRERNLCSSNGSLLLITFQHEPR